MHTWRVCVTEPDERTHTHTRVNVKQQHRCLHNNIHNIAALVACFTIYLYMRASIQSWGLINIYIYICIADAVALLVGGRNQHGTFNRET